MPLIINQYESDYRIVLWKLTEPLDFFENKARLTPYDTTIYSKIKNIQRKKEWLAVRVMFFEALGYWPNITYYETGKPIINNHTRHLSISHSKEMVGILLCTSPYAGIDIEKNNRNIDKILNRFLSPDELANIEKNPSSENKIIHWCAKEAIFKSVNTQNIDFSKQIKIVDIKKNGTLKGICKCHKETIHYDLRYYNIDGHIVVWTT
ncbi:MAG: 4'-phosphopantetheinyl transferase superfamily protein [Prolixibacteraceae bacterium]|nr:4'-phosphopantetheinyl transferase superfamily protein [Prolixibacteraceae bacterium]